MSRFIYCVTLHYTFHSSSLSLSYGLSCLMKNYWEKRKGLPVMGSQIALVFLSSLFSTNTPPGTTDDRHRRFCHIHQFRAQTAELLEPLIEAASESINNQKCGTDTFIRNMKCFPILHIASAVVISAFLPK